MGELDFDKRAYQTEHMNRLSELRSIGEMDSVKPNQVVVQKIREAIFMRNPFVQESDPFVVMGNDGFDGSWFPTGSFQTVEDAFEYAEENKKEEYLYSTGNEISTTFHVFTSDGIQVNFEPTIQS